MTFGEKGWLFILLGGILVEVSEPGFPPSIFRVMGVFGFYFGIYKLVWAYGEILKRREQEKGSNPRPQ